MNNKTIEQIKEEKRRLEQDILSLINNFEESTNAGIASIELEHVETIAYVKYCIRVKAELKI